MTQIHTTTTRWPIDQLDHCLDLLRTVRTALLSDCIDTREQPSLANVLDLAIDALGPIREQINAAHAA